MIKAGFIGFGRMGITHFSMLNTHPKVKIMAVCDQSSTMLKVLNKYVDVKCYKNYKKMLDEIKLDCVLISTPGDSHAEIIMSCIRKGIHVFVEKPFTMTSSEGREIVDEIAEKPIVNQVGYVNRFNEVFMEVKRLIDDGIIGKVVNFSGEMHGATVLKDSKSSWRGKKSAGGGCLFEFASHCIDLVIYLFDKPDTAAGSIMQSIYSSEVEDLVSASFLYKNGCSGSIFVNWSDETYRKPTNIIKILGTHGKIIADKHAFKIYLKEKDTRHGFDQGWNTRYITDFGKPARFYLRGNEFTNQLDCFIDCIDKGEQSNIASFAEALKTDIIMDAITQDAARNLPREGRLTGNADTQDKASFWKRITKRKD
jgi:predicted dehydrogenase